MFPFYDNTEKLQRAKSNNKKESCPFCQEQKKRPLIAYMRKRAQEKNGKICEEEAEEEAPAQQQHQQQHCHANHHHRGHAANGSGSSSNFCKENAK